MSFFALGRGVERRLIKVVCAHQSTISAMPRLRETGVPVTAWAEPFRRGACLPYTLTLSSSHRRCRRMTPLPGGPPRYGTAVGSISAAYAVWSLPPSGEVAGDLQLRTTGR